MSGYEVVTSAYTINDVNFKIRSISCPTGKTAIAGGAQFANVAQRLPGYSSYPSASDTWTVEAGSNSPNAFSFRTYAVCATLAP